jgi:hypothetical protein
MDLMLNILFLCLYSSMDCVVDSRGNTNTWLTVRCTNYKVCE